MLTKAVALATPDHTVGGDSSGSASRGVFSPRGDDVDDRQARAILEARVEAGGKLVVGQESDWAGIKRLQERCHEAGIPTVLGNSPPGG